MGKQVMTNIDPEKLRAFVEEHGPAQVEAAIGKARYYFKNVYKRGKMPANVLAALCSIYDVEKSALTPDDPETEFVQFEIKPVEIREDTGIEFETELVDNEDMSSVLHVTMRCGDKSYTGKSAVYGERDPWCMARGMIDALNVILTLIEQDDLR